MKKITITNTAPGIRGIALAGGGIRNLEPGATDTVTVDDAEADDLPEYFTLAGSESAGEDDAEAVKEKTVAELKAEAAEKGIDLDALTGTGGNGRVVKADIEKAIADHDAKAAAGAGAGAGDAIDAMSDDELRATVKALTGADAPADADRAALVALARGS